MKGRLEAYPTRELSSSPAASSSIVANSADSPEGGLERRSIASSISAKVTSSFFLGDRTRLLVEGVSAGTLIVETTDRRDWEPGQDVYLAIDPDALLTLDR